jgi:hypothetical protein
LTDIRRTRPAPAIPALEEGRGISSYYRGAGGRFVPEKKRGGAAGRTKRGKGSRIMAIADASGLPVSVCLASASPHEVKLAETVLDTSSSLECQRNLSATKRMTVTISIKYSEKAGR